MRIRTAGRPTTARSGAGPTWVRAVAALLGLAVGAALTAGVATGGLIGTADAQEPAPPWPYGNSAAPSPPTPLPTVPAVGLDGRPLTEPGERDVPAPTDASGGGGGRMVALGDSWAAGTATASAADPGSGECRRTVDAYPALLAPSLVGPGWTSRACASDRGAANGQFASLTADTDVVTVTVGADATGLGGFARACGAAGDSGACDAAGATFDRALVAVPAALDASFADLRIRAPRARVVVTGLPLLTEGQVCSTGPLDATRAERLDVAVIRLDAVLAERTQAAGLIYVDVRDAFRGHAVCAVDPWLAPLTAAEPLLAGGPTRTGHAVGLRPAIDRALRTPATTGAPPPVLPPAPTVPPLMPGRASAELLRPLFAG